MCLLVKAAPNTEFPLSWFVDCYESNPDGLGIAFVANGEVVVRKMLPAGPHDAYQWWQDNAPKDTEYALHWRMRTHGAVDIERVHPYPVDANGKIHLMHNGVLSISGDTTKESDTQIYARTYGAALAPVVHEPLVRQMVGNHIGGNNRFIFIHAEHGLLLVNAHTGVTTEQFPGCWFSNTYAWNARQWGVGGGSGKAHYANAAWASAFGDYDDADADVVGKVARGVGAATNNASDAMADDLQSFRADPSVQKYLTEMFDLARAARHRGDVAANRFLSVYDDETELLAVLPVFYNTPAEAASDLLSGVQYVESGTVDFDDVLGWYTVDVEDGTVIDVDGADAPRMNGTDVVDDAYDSDSDDSTLNAARHLRSIMTS